MQEVGESARKLNRLSVRKLSGNLTDNSPWNPRGDRSLVDLRIALAFDLRPSLCFKRSTISAFFFFSVVILDPKQMNMVKEALHVSTLPNTVVCREDEQMKVLEFCKECIQKEKAGCVYVSGCPGTGKSLSMARVERFLLEWTKEVKIEFCYSFPTGKIA